MTRVYSFVCADRKINGKSVYVACAITDKGKWLAGSVSQEADVAVERCHAMAILKIRQGRESGNLVVSGEVKFEKIFDEPDRLLPDRVIAAMQLAFATMP